MSNKAIKYYEIRRSNLSILVKVLHLQQVFEFLNFRFLKKQCISKTVHHMVCKIQKKITQNPRICKVLGQNPDRNGAFARLQVKFHVSQGFLDPIQTAYLQGRGRISRDLAVNRRYILLGKEFQPILQQDAALLLIPVFGGKSGMFGECAAFHFHGA